MGCSSPSNFKGQYNICSNNPDKKENETYIYRNLSNPTMDKIYPFDTLQSIMKNLFDKSDPNAPVFEERIKGNDGEYTMKTKFTNYGKFRSDCENLGRGFINMDLCKWHAEYKNFNLRFIGIYAKNSYKYFVQDMASVMFNFVSVPIYDTLGEEATIFVFENTLMETLCLTANHFDGMIKLKESGKIESLSNFIIIDDDEAWDESFRERGQQAGVNVYKWAEVIESGAKGEQRGWEVVKPDDIYCFSYTSGTTGTPKGAMLSHKNMATTIQASYSLLNVTKKDKHLSYLPLAHVMERIIGMSLLSMGCIVGIFAGNIRKIKEDLSVFKPTIFISVPRLYNRFYDVIKGKIAALEGFKGNLAKKAVRIKLENLKKNGEVTHWLYDKLVFKKMKAVLGGRVRFMVTGSAPLNREVADMLKICMCCSMVEGYGQTEGTGAEFGMKISDTNSGHVGGVMEHNEFKLVDVPDMNYTNKDVDEKTREPTPRGEIWVRGGGIIPGYYKNDEKNAETFTEDGWLMSGDIGKIDPSQKQLVIIDRKKNIFKLSQGEYIAPEKLEGNYKTISPLFRDIYIYGDSLKSCIIAIVTIEKENQRALANEMNVCNDVEDSQLISHPDYIDGLKKLFKAKAKEVKFNGLEIPKGFVINETPFEELGLLTTSFKMKRKPIADYFMDRLNEEYTKLY
jgi:long-chain acyl-CoA synthetase